MHDFLVYFSNTEVSLTTTTIGKISFWNMLIKGRGDRPNRSKMLSFYLHLTLFFLVLQNKNFQKLLVH